MLNSFFSVRISDFLFLLYYYHEKLINVIIRQVGRMFHIYFIFRFAELFKDVTVNFLIFLKNLNYLKFYYKIYNFSDKFYDMKYLRFYIHFHVSNF